MEDALKEAVEIVKAQAGVRVMGDSEIQNMITSLANTIKNLAEANVIPEPEVLVDPKTSIREKTVLCCECGKSFKVLTKRHLETHGLTTAEYLEKHGFKKGTSLTAKSLARDRRKRMSEMKLWERRKKAK